MEYEEMKGIEFPVPAVIVSYRRDAWKFEDVNEEFLKLVGYSREEILELDEGSKLFSGKDVYAFEETLELACKTKSVEEFELRIVKKNKENCWVSVRCSLLYRKDVVPFFSVIFWDIDESKKKELQLKLLNHQYQMIEEVSDDIPLDINVEDWSILRSTRVMDMLGNLNSKDEYFPFDMVAEMVHPMEREKYVTEFRNAAKEVKSGMIEARVNVSKLGDSPVYVWFRTVYRSVADEEGKIIRIIGRTINIDKDMHLQEEIKRDPLTKLLNKVSIQQEIEKVLEASTERCHVMFFVDLDNFKPINDNFGHTYGDTVINEAADVLRTQFRSSDLIGRVGGDEFLVLMLDTTIDKAQKKAENLCHFLGKTYTGGGLSIKISSSIGLAALGEHGSTYKELLDAADQAMYQVKDSGKDGYRWAQGEQKEFHRARKQINSRSRNFKMEDRDFLSFALTLMVHARNIDGSLDLLLKHIAQRYDLDSVLVYEDRKSIKTSNLTNYFTIRTDDVIARELPLPKMNYLGPGDVVVLDQKLKDSVKLTKEQLSEAAGTNFGNAVVSRYEHMGGKTGLMFFCSSDMEREWNESELEVFAELARTIAIFVELRHRMDEGKAEVRHIQKRDQLTDLYNLEAFKEKARSLMRRHEPDKVYAIEYLDINNFGYVNENYGYQVGDKILKMFASDVKSQNFFMAGCRLYSDFFILLLCDDSKEMLERHITERNRRFSNMQNHQYPSSSMGITEGIYLFDDVACEIDVAVENATLAYKYAKQNRCNDIVFFTEQLRQKRVEEQQIIGEFYEALYRNDFQIVLQPKFLLGKREVYGAEALVRWRKPDGTTLVPARFMGAIERIGYITELDFYVFEETVKLLNKWKNRNDKNLVLSTNFSGRHFEKDKEEFLRRIFHIVEKYEVEPSQLEIEITESTLVKNVDVLRECILELRECGIRIAIDDFGTGYSSLAILSLMPADVVKIDKSFIEGEVEELNQEFLAEMGKFVKLTGKDVICEGVETKEQEEFLMRNGYDKGQGYLVDRPLSIGSFEQKYLSNI